MLDDLARDGDAARPAVAGPPEVPVPPRGRAPQVGAIAVVVVVIAVVGGALVLGGGDRNRSGQTDAATSRRNNRSGSTETPIVAEARSFRYSYILDVPGSIGLDDDGGVVPAPETGEGEWAGDRWHFEHRGSVNESEMIVVGETIYERSDEHLEGGDLSTAPWSHKDLAPYKREDLLDYLEMLRDGGEAVVEDEMPSLLDVIVVLVAGTVYLEGGVSPSDGMASGFSGDPRGFLHVIEQMADAEVALQMGDTVTLAKTLTPSEDVAEAYGSDLPDGRAELDLDAAGEPVALRLDIARGVAEAHIAVEFSHWNEPVEIAPPSDDGVDEFAYVDEATLREVTTTFTLYTSASLAEDWTLRSMIHAHPIKVVDVEADPTLEDCPAVQLAWSRREERRAGGGTLGDLVMYQFTSDCALRSDPTPFEPGGPGDLPYRWSLGRHEVQIGGTVIAVFGSVAADELEAVLTDLQPVDVETLMATVTVE